MTPRKVRFVPLLVAAWLASTHARALSAQRPEQRRGAPSSRTETASAANTLVPLQVIDVSAFSPPSPDPAGITFLPGTGTLLLSDSEVNETALFTGDNLFELAPTGTLVSTATTLPATKEPTGLALNPTNQHLFVSDDEAPPRVLEVDPGADGLHGTGDDLITSLQTADFGSEDPEGVAYDPTSGTLFVLDGDDKEVFLVDPGANGLFDGVAPVGDDVVSSFDVGYLGVEDPEGIDFDPATGTLLIVDREEQVLLELTTAGALIGSFDISAVFRPASVAVAPSALTPGEDSIWITDRGFDNGEVPGENDGKLYEFERPPSPNQAPIVDAGPDLTLTLPQRTAQLAGSVSDDGMPGPPAATSILWSQVGGPATVVFADPTDPQTTVTFPGRGRYVLRLTADDTELVTSDEVSILVLYPGPLTTVVVRPLVRHDDAEEKASGSVNVSSSDLELMVEDELQIVGLRFPGVPIPPGATIASASIQFQVDESSGGLTHLILEAEAADDAALFSTAIGDVSSRARTAASVQWAPAPWTTVGAAGPDQRTPNMASVIQEIVDRPGWSSGNAIAVIVRGTGNRVAESGDGAPGGEPFLQVTYSSSAPPRVARRSAP